MPMIYDLSNEYGGKIISDTDNVGEALLVEGGVAGFPALRVKKTVVGSPTAAPFEIAHTSAASAAVMKFGSFISVTSILGVAATGAGLGFDYVIPVSLNGVIRGIPVTSLASLNGAAAF